MDKSQIIDKIKEGKCTHEQIISWIKVLPGSMASRKPIINKKGDVYMHPIFKHPYVLLEKKRGYWICGLLTTETECPEIIEPCESRFFAASYFTRVLFTAVQPSGAFINCFDNIKQLRSINSKLKEIFN